MQCVPISDVSHNANTISSHIAYKIMTANDDSLRLKARIAPHENEDSVKHLMKSDSAMCSPMRIRILLADEALKRRTVSRADITSTLLQTECVD